MCPSQRLFATVKSAAKFLEPNVPTGLTGITTHPAPRPALIYTYQTTLAKLALLPSSSVYRQSTEALTKKRLSIVESTKPAGYDEWLARVKKQIETSPDAYANLIDKDGSLRSEKIYTEQFETWDGQLRRGDGKTEGGLQSKEEAGLKAQAIKDEIEKVDMEEVKGQLPTVADLEKEPPLDAAQINDIETKIEAGLIEEVLMVAEGELTLVDQMLESKAWEPLEEKPAEGQWKYFERADGV